MPEPFSKHIVIGITGGIAAYKTLSLIRLFKSAGWEVKPVATQNALEFVTPLSIETLAQNNLYCDTFARNFTYDVHHVALATWADAIVVAPATANILAKLANGIADDALSTLLLATEKPVFMAPAMNTRMYGHAAVQANLQILASRGVHLIGPQAGDLACGTRGMGRMEEPENIFATITKFFESDQPLKGKKAIVTAGPTHEALDPVRFIGNHSSGKMGFALAEVLAERGAEVVLIAGPTSLTVHHPNIKKIDVTSAAEMAAAALNEFPDCQMAVMAAAVADYTPKTVAQEKIKKHDETFTLELVKTTDILKELGKRKQSGQILVGFALETENELQNAQTKLQNKNADFIVLNSLKDENAGFGYSTNRITILDKTGGVTPYELKSKQEVATDIVNVITNELNKQNI